MLMGDEDETRTIFENVKMGLVNNQTLEESAVELKLECNWAIAR